MMQTRLLPQQSLQSGAAQEMGGKRLSAGGQVEKRESGSMEAPARVG